MDSPPTKYKRDPEKAKIYRKRYIDKILESKKFHCELCDKSFRGNFELKRHDSSVIHQALCIEKAKEEEDRKNIRCLLCNCKIRTQTEYIRHRQTKKHERNMKANDNPEKWINTNMYEG